MHLHRFALVAMGQLEKARPVYELALARATTSSEMGRANKDTRIYASDLANLL